MTTLIAAVLLLQEPPRTSEDFRAAFGAARSPGEKAALVRAFAVAGPRDEDAAAALARALAPHPADPHRVVPLAAVDALGRFRGSAAAARALAAALPLFRRSPGARARLMEAIGRVGHPSLLPMLEKAAAEPDVEAALAAVRAIRDYPAGDALDSLFRLHDAVARRSSEEAPDPVASFTLRALHRVSGETYPTIEEMKIWWRRRREGFRDVRGEPPAGEAGPLPAIELRFREGAGNSTANSGLCAGEMPTAFLSHVKWSDAAALNGGPGSLEWTRPGGAVDVDAAALRDLKSFTLTLWARTAPGDERPETGRRLLSWLGPGKNGGGVELARRNDGSLQLGIGGPAEESPARSPAGLLPAADPKGADPLAAWRFVAASWDGSTVRFYVGTWQSDASLVSEHPLARENTGSRASPRLSVGNVVPCRRAGPDASFRGVIDEVRVFAGPFDASGALSLAGVVRVQNREPRE